MLDDVTGPGASPQALKKPAGLTNRAFVIVERWDQLDQSVREAGKGVRR
jgi:hypothetical protein